MKRAHSILIKTFQFIKAIWLITQKVTKQVVLPTRRRKGNLLSSLLMLFIAVTDLVTNFSWGISLNSLSQWKHYDRLCRLAKKGVLIAGFLLFLLSSFEWSCPASNILRQNDTIAKAEQQPARKLTTPAVAYYSIVAVNSYPPRLPSTSFPHSCDIENGYLAVPKIYLHYCDLRI